MPGSPIRLRHVWIIWYDIMYFVYNACVVETFVLDFTHDIGPQKSETANVSPSTGLIVIDGYWQVSISTTGTVNGLSSVSFTAFEVISSFHYFVSFAWSVVIIANLLLISSGHIAFLIRTNLSIGLHKFVTWPTSIEFLPRRLNLVTDCLMFKPHSILEVFFSRWSTRLNRPQNSDTVDENGFMY